jgi:hypothetical protein
MSEVIAASSTTFSRAESLSSLITAPTAFLRPVRPVSVSEQLSDTSCLRFNADINELPSVELKGKSYIRKEHTYRKRKRNAWVKDHGIYLILLPDRKKTFWLCRLCDKKHKVVIFSALSTNAAQEYMQKAHKVTGFDNDDDDNKDRDGKEKGVRDVLQMQKMATKDVHIAKTKHTSFKTYLIDWLVDQNIPLTAIKHDSFRDLLTILAIDINNFLPRSHATIGKWLITEFNQKKLRIKQQLHKDTRNKIHLFFDMWTSEN